MQLRCVGEKVYEHLIDGRKIASLYVPSYDSDSDDDDLFADWGFEEGFDPLDYKMDYAYTYGYPYGCESEGEPSYGNQFGYAGYEEFDDEEVDRRRTKGPAIPPPSGR
ncbi:mynd domain-containing protein [Colletotrichum musicola]|uniref:Mynd domain-containing protein n=1 Tax=Colletotrichum musicola TaxID=2175873 RepID=A0A8H6IJM1_9PEZI|nr:mynd domain-containing protein [Colletotrichum musicola]